jgi:hypothetical protein
MLLLPFRTAALCVIILNLPIFYQCAVFEHTCGETAVRLQQCLCDLHPRQLTSSA